MKDYYKILGLNRDATLAQIKKAYREKVKMYHPDAGGSKEDQDRLMEVQEAYEVLSDEQKRKRYDEDLRRLTQEAERFSEISFRVLLSPLEAKYGTRFYVKIPTMELCPNCGLRPDVFCPVCDGHGFIPKTRPVSVTIPPGVRNGSSIRFSLKIGEDKNIRITIKIFVSTFCSVL